MMKYIFTTITTLLILVYACAPTSVSEIDSSKAKTIALKFDYDDIDIMSLIDIIEFIPLETTDKSIVGKIAKIVCRQDKYYIFDEQQEIVLIFDITGRFLTKIDKQGQGPAEYENIFDMQISSTGDISILGRTTPAKIIKYKESGTESVIVQGMSGDNVFPLENGYLFYSESGDNRRDNRFHLYSTDKKGNVKNKWLPSHKYIKYGMGGYKIFDSFNDTILFTMPFDNNIYQISQKEEISVRYTFDYGKCQLPESVKELFFKEDLAAFREQSEGYVRGLDSWFETDKVLLLSYINTSVGSPFFGLYYKVDNVLKVLKPNDLITISILTPYFSSNDFFVGIIEVSSFRFDEYPDYKQTIYQKCPELIRTIDLYNLSEESNPILVKYKFKNK